MTIKMVDCKTDGHLYCRRGSCIWCGDRNSPAKNEFVKTIPEKETDKPQ